MIVVIVTHGEGDHLFIFASFAGVVISGCRVVVV